MSSADDQALLPPGVPGPVLQRTVVATGTRLAVVELGLAQAPAFVVAHGAGSSARFVAAAFARPVLGAGWRLVTYDLRGHGSSSPARQRSEHHLDVHAADLAAVVASTSGDVEVVGGISLGAHAAVRAMAIGVLAPAVTLAVLPAWTGRAVAGTGPHAAIAAEVRRAGVADLIGRLRGDDQLPAWLWHQLLYDLPRHDPQSLAAALVALDGGMAPAQEEVAGLRGPLAVVGWSGDPGHPLEEARRWARLAPRAELVELGLGDLDDGLERLGGAAVRAVCALCAAAVGR